MRDSRCAWPIHRDEAASARRSEPAKPEYQKVRPSAAGTGAPPGLRKRRSTMMAITKKMATSVIGSARLELEALIAEPSGTESGGELTLPDPGVGAMLGSASLPKLGTSGVTLAGTVTLGAARCGVPPAADFAAPPADFVVETFAGAAAFDVEILGVSLTAGVDDASWPVDLDTVPVELGFNDPEVTGPEDDALPDGEDTGFGVVWVGVVEVGVVDVGAVVVGVVEVDVVDVGVIGVCVGSMGEADTVGPELVVTGVDGLDVGVLPDDEEVDVEPVDCPGEFDVWVVFVGGEDVVGDPDVVGELGCCGEEGVDVGIVPWLLVVGGTASKTNAFPLLSTAAHDEVEMHETAFRLPRRSSSVGADHAVPS
jgi:hypothetical protein